MSETRSRRARVTGPGETMEGAAVVNGRTVVALSGPDNVGKSTQLRILARRCPHTTAGGPLHDHDPRWQRITATGMARWWFHESSPQELADVLATSYLPRHSTHGDILLLDRGMPMLEATLA